MNLFTRTFSKIFKSSNQQELDRIQNIILAINSKESEIKSFTESDFKEKTANFKKKAQNGSLKLNEIIPETFALVREAAKRTLGERHYDVQLSGGLILHNGKIAEMKTGEGKTLVSTLPAYLNSLTGKGVHIVTVNDYLALRDSAWMGKVFNYLGVSTGCITNNLDDHERKKNYACDITYATNNELGFDYLRDNMKYELNEMVQRGHNFCIVDEVDSILIDESRTPLIISGKIEDRTTLYSTSNEFIKNLQKNDYELDEKNKNVILTDAGVDKIEKLALQKNILKNKNFYDPANLDLVHHTNQALKANLIFKKDTDYIVSDGKVQIIDEFTGRVLGGRRFSDGLHQAIEAKENVEIQEENQTLASITYQNYFKLYEKLSGCTGTALTEAEEFLEIYNLSVTVIPTNKKMIRKDWNDQIFRTEKEKNIAIIKKISECYKIGQPTLVFTSSVNKSEQYSSLLNKEKIPHVVLNAKNHEKEAEIIANAGKLNSVIITTSISGRGVDIQLGGKKEDLEGKKLLSEKNKIKSLGGLFVIGTERMESRRVDNQARGRSGRQGDEGNSIFFVSLDDDLMRIFGSESMNTMLEKLGLKDGESIDHPWINKALERAQQKVEARNFDMRKTLLKFDNVLNDQRHVIFSQRNNIINTNEIFNYSETFLDETIDQLISEKNLSINPKKSKDFETRVKTLVGKSFNDEEIKNLSEVNNDEFKDKLKNKFLEKRNERLKKLGDDQSKEIEKRIFLQAIDANWKLHIQYLEQLRQVIGLRSYGQRDPLVEYKKEAFNLFENLLSKLKFDLITILLNLTIIEKNEENDIKKNNKIVNNPKCLLILSKGKKISRNDICEATGKKYKHCCGRF